MTTAARDRLARALRGGGTSAFSFGPVKFPVTPARARKLLGLGYPARFGRGEETLTDADVRDTWKIPKHLVRAEWEFEWPLAKQRRQHIHSRIDAAELPVTHVTRRQGSPYTLVLKKTDALFAREHEARARDHADLEWLAARWHLGA